MFTQNKKYNINTLNFIYFKLLNKTECFLVLNNPEDGLLKKQTLYYEKIEKNN